jgi:hypothetical protein
MGRPSLHQKGAMTAAERQRRHRQKVRAEQVVAGAERRGGDGASYDAVGRRRGLSPDFLRLLAEITGEAEP